MKQTFKALLMVAIAILVGVGTVYAAAYCQATGSIAPTTSHAELDRDCLDFTSDSDTIFFGASSDTIFMDEGDDQLNFGSGNDRIYFGDGQEWISFGEENAWMTWGCDGGSPGHVYANMKYDDTSKNIEITSGGDVIITLGAEPQELPMTP